MLSHIKHNILAEEQHGIGRTDHFIATENDLAENLNAGN